MWNVHANIFSISQNTGQEFDGSDSGARPDEAISWGKIRAGAEAVKASKNFFKISLLLNVYFRFSRMPRWSFRCWLQPHSRRMFPVDGKTKKLYVFLRSQPNNRHKRYNGKEKIARIKVQMKMLLQSLLVWL